PHFLRRRALAQTLIMDLAAAACEGTLVSSKDSGNPAPSSRNVGRLVLASRARRATQRSPGDVPQLPTPVSQRDRSRHVVGRAGILTGERFGHRYVGGSRGRRGARLRRLGTARNADARDTRRSADRTSRRAATRRSRSKDTGRGGGAG